MLGAAHSKRPERHLALIAHELSRLNVDIPVLSEVRFPGEGSLQEHGTRYTLFCSGKPTTEGHPSGVGFTVRTSIAPKLEYLPTGHSDSMMSMHPPLKNKRYATLFFVYSPTLRAEPTEKDMLYSELRSCLQNTPADDKVMILGNFNYRVCKDADSCKGVLGKHGVGNCNDNGCLLQELCIEQLLAITNTIFQLCLICSIPQRKLRELQNEWWTNIAKRTQQYADLGDYRGSYRALKAEYGPTRRVQNPCALQMGKCFL